MQGDSKPDLSLFFKNVLCKVKARGQHFSLIYFGRPQLGHTIKVNCIPFQTADPEISPILIFYNSVWD